MLKLKNIYKSFKIAGKKKSIISNLNLSIKKGEIIAITGESGCGKTTILNIISGLTIPDNGSVYVNDKKIYYFLDIIPAWIRNRKIGLIYQTFRLINEESVISNILLPARIKGKINKKTKEKLFNLLENLGIKEFIHTKVARLSGGQKQRVTIARALINDPEIILADEPTANLDKQTSREIFKILEAFVRNKTKTIIIMTHKDYMLKRADKVYEMKNGTLTLKMSGKKKKR